MPTMLIYQPVITPRSRYLFHLVFRERLGMDMELTSREEDYLRYDGPKFCYARDPVDSGLFFHDKGLLSEDQISPWDAGIARYRDKPVLFPVQDPRSGFPFDVFSAIFYLVTRYEEYLPFAPDPYGRFRPEESLAFRGHFLDEPVVDHWTSWMGELLVQRFHGLRLHPPGYRFCPTIDIDHFYAFRGRGHFRTAGGFARSLLRGEVDLNRQRIRVLAGKENDPYDVYGSLGDLHRSFGLKPYFFILFASYGGDDNNISPGAASFRRALKDLDGSGKVGIHPSLRSNRDEGLVKKEKAGLEALLGRDVTASRQHFLAIRLPDTYRKLASLGIRDDFSMGYASIPGFRASTAAPFRFFDLEKNEEAPLVVHPLPLMDVTLKDYLNLIPGDAADLSGDIIRKVRSVNGEMVLLWHNESFSGWGSWKGWQEIYREILTKAI